MRVEIMYDFDYKSLDYYKEGLNIYPNQRFSGNVEKYTPISHLKKSDNIELLYLLGTGLDKLSITESENNKSIIIEPCPAIFFICRMEECFEYMITQLKSGSTTISDGGIYSMENNFRIEGNRPNWIIHVSFELSKLDEKWILNIGKSGEKSILEMPFDTFLSAYFEFGERMKRFYLAVIPELEQLKIFAKFNKAVYDSCILEKFNLKKQSSFDENTFYDFQ